MTTVRRLLAFPNPVNQLDTRVVAGGVALLAVIALVTGWQWVIVVLALGSLARFLAGPRFSLLGQLARVVTPRLGSAVPVPGPPIRFAYGIAFGLATLAGLASIGFGLTWLAAVLVSVVLTFSLMQSVINFCTGGWLFNVMMRAGLVSAETQAACDEVTQKYGESRPSFTVPD